MYPLHVLYKKFIKISFLQTFSYIVRTNNYILTEIAPNIYFGSDYTHKKIFLKFIKINPYFGR